MASASLSLVLIGCMHLEWEPTLRPQLPLVMSMHVEAWWHPDEASILVIMTWIATILQGQHAHMHGKCLSKFGVDWMYALGVGANLTPSTAPRHEHACRGMVAP